MLAVYMVCILSVIGCSVLNFGSKPLSFYMYFLAVVDSQCHAKYVLILKVSIIYGQSKVGLITRMLTLNVIIILNVLNLKVIII